MDEVEKGENFRTGILLSINPPALYKGDQKNSIPKMRERNLSKFFLFGKQSKTLQQRSQRGGRKVNPLTLNLLEPTTVGARINP